jgi:D-alanyl-D-alanine carboxypeptidase
MDERRRKQSADSLSSAAGAPGTIALSRQRARTTLAVSGVRDLSTQAPIRTGDRFRIGSNTKTFVATVVLQLVGEGQLRLTDNVERWLPAMVPGGAAITVRHYWPPRDLVALATSHPPQFPPGTAFGYSNTNYILLGLIIEAATRHTAAAEIQRRLIRPLGLADTSFPQRDPHIAGRHTRGNLTNLPPDATAPDGTQDITVLSPSTAWTAGGIISTAPDLAHFHRALITGRLLRPAQQRELTTTAPGADYAMGVFRIDTPCGPAWGHDGSFPGYLSLSFTSPDGTRQAVIAVNTDRILSEQAYTELSTAFDTAYCGRHHRTGRYDGHTAKPGPSASTAWLQTSPTPMTLSNGVSLTVRRPG